MTILVGSRYAKGVVGFVTDAAGRSRQTVLRDDITAGPTTSLYDTRAGDRLDFIAFRAYGRSDLWWYIADANPDMLLADPLPPGLTLRIPSAPDDI